MVETPIVQWPMHFKFERADGMGDAFDIIAQAMSEIVHRINAPFVASVMMLRMANAIEQGVPHPDVRRSHVDFRSQRALAIRELPLLHPREEVQTFLGRPVAPGAVLAGSIGRAA